MTRRCIAISLLLFVLLAGCSEMRELLALQRGLVAEFETEAVTVSIEEGSKLTVAFIDSPFSGETGPGQAPVARRAAEYVFEHYERSEGLSAVYVVFGEKRSAGTARVTVTGDPFVFTRVGLSEPVGDVLQDSTSGENLPPN